MKKRFPFYILCSLAVSILIGLLLQSNVALADKFKPLGTVYISLIKMVMVPLVFSSLVLGISSISDLRKLGKLGGLTVVIFLLTTAMAVIIGLFLSGLMKPGSGIVLSSETYELKEFPSIIDTFTGIIPDNMIKAMADGNMLQIIFISIILGIGIVKTGENGKQLEAVISSLYNVTSCITNGIMYITPLGILGLMIPVVASNGIDVLLPLIKVILAFYLGVVIQLFIVYGGLLKSSGYIRVKDFIKGIFPAQVIAFTTCSSAAALPVSLQCAQSELKISREVAGFVLPLGATINMDGNALYQGIVALFVAQAYGVELTVPMMLMVILTGTLASIGAAGVPGAGMIVLSTVLISAGLPVDGIVLVAGIDRILDMGRTLVNITGDVVTACVVEKLVNK